MPIPRPPQRRLSPGLMVLLAVLAVLMALSAYGVYVAFRMGAGASISVHGYVALGLAVVFTALLAGGLITLAFYSARHGYDDQQGDDQQGKED